MDDHHELIKHRELVFCSLHPDPEQAGSAMLLLSDVVGIIHLERLDTHRLALSYDIRHLTLNLIEDALIELGFHLDNSLLFKLKRALYYYTESVQCENLDCQNGPCTRNIFVNRYSRLQHGCRDDRPHYWRKYL